MATRSRSRSETVRTTRTHPAQYLAFLIGVVFLLIGIAGFFVTGFDAFAQPEGDLLFGFEVNPLHNVVHLVIGALGVGMWRPLALARTYGWILAIGYGAAFVYGLFFAGSTEPANFLALNTADNWLHLVSALAGLLIALWPGGRRRR